MKVLFIYPTEYHVTGLPIGIASIASVLIREGHQVKIFDTAFYPNDTNQSLIRYRSGGTKKIENESSLYDNDTEPLNDLLSLIKQEYRPDIVGVTLVEPTFELGIKLTRAIKKDYSEILIVGGGVMPTLNPEYVINEWSIDAVCVGEGENVMKDLLNRISNKKQYYDIRGLWIKKEGNIVKNGISHLNDIAFLPHPNFEYFDQRLLYKPMQGKLYKMINIETSRGCPNQCGYCTSPNLTRIYHKNNCGNYYRKIPIDNIVDQLYYQIDKYKPEFIYFSSETFLDMGEKDFNRFVEIYSEIKLPFWFQTRFETLSVVRLKKLKDIGMFWLTCGIEHGNENFRKKILQRKYSNSKVIDSMKMLASINQGVSLNNIMGFPFENRKLVFDTIMLNREANRINSKARSAINIFAPYYGCKLYNVCKKENLLDNKNYYTNHLDGVSDLLFDDKWKMELRGLMRVFNLYVRLPDKYFDHIKKAEQLTAEGDMIFEKLLNVMNDQYIE